MAKRKTTKPLLLVREVWSWYEYERLSDAEAHLARVKGSTLWEAREVTARKRKTKRKEAKK